MKGFMSQLASGSVGKNWQEGFGSLANKAQGLAQGLAHGLPKNATPGVHADAAHPRASEAPALEAQLQLQVPYNADEESAVLRQQVVQLQVKNGMLQAELEEARGFAEESAQLRGLVADLEVKLLFALKGTEGMQPLLPKVIQEQQKRVDELTATLAERNGHMTGLRADNTRLRCQVEDLMNKMASSARHAEATHNEHLRELQSQLAEAQEDVRQLRTAAEERSNSRGGTAAGEPSDGGEVEMLRRQLQHARDMIQELEEETVELRVAAEQARVATAAAGSRGAGRSSGSADAREWRIAELEEQLEEATDKLHDAERKLGMRAAGGLSGAAAAALEAEVQKLRGEVESERSRVANVAAEAAAEATKKAEAALQRLNKRMEDLELGECAAVAARDAAERRAVDLELQQEAAVKMAAEAVAETATGKAAVAELQSQLDEAVARAAVLEQELAVSTVQRAALQQQLSSTVATASAAHVEGAKELTAVRAEAAALRAEAAEVRGRAEALTVQLSEAQRALAASEQRAAELASELNIAGRKLEGATTRIVLYTEREHEAEQIIASYRAAEERYAESQERIERLESQIVQLQAALGLAQEELTTARLSVEQSQEQAHFAYDNAAKLRGLLDKLKDRQLGLEAELQGLTDQLATSQQELQTATSSLASQATDSCSQPQAVALGMVASSQTDGPPPAASVSTDTAGLPHAEMPTAATNTEEVPLRQPVPTAVTITSVSRPVMLTTSTDTRDPQSEPDQPPEEAEGGSTWATPSAPLALSSDSEPDPGQTSAKRDVEQLQQVRLVSELMEELQRMQVCMAAATTELHDREQQLRQQLEEREQQLKLRDFELVELRSRIAQVVTIGLPSSSTAAADKAEEGLFQTAEKSVPDAQVKGPGLPVTAGEGLLLASEPGDGWKQDGDDNAREGERGHGTGNQDEDGMATWDADDASASQVPGAVRAAANSADTHAAESEAAESGSSVRGIICTAPVEGALREHAANAAQVQLTAAYSSELALLQDTIKQLLHCWSGGTTAAAEHPPLSNGHSSNGFGGHGLSNGHGEGRSNNSGSSTGADAVQEAAVLGGTVVALLEQLRVHFAEAEIMRQQLLQVAEELARLRAAAESCGGPAEAAAARRAGGASDDDDVVQRMVELEAEIQHMMQDLSAAEQRSIAAEGAAAAATSWRQQLEQQLQRSDEAAAEAEASARRLQGELDAALEEAEVRAVQAGSELEVIRVQLAEALAALAAAKEAGVATAMEAKSALADAKAATEAAEVRANDALAVASAAEVRLKEAEARVAQMQRVLVAEAVEAQALETKSAATTTVASVPILLEQSDLLQTLTPLCCSLKASQISLANLSRQVSDLETLATKLNSAVAAAARTDVGVAGAPPTKPPSYEQSFEAKNIGPAAAMLLAAEAVEERPAAPMLGERPRVPSGNRRVSEDTTSAQQRLEALEAAARAAEMELRIQTNLAESLRAEVQEQQAAIAALRASTVPKEAAAEMEAFYQAQVKQLQGFLGRAADKQARQLAALEEEHSQVVAVEQAQRAAAVAAAARAAEERVAALEGQLEGARRNAAALEERAAAAVAEAENAKKLAQDIERGWGERVERLQKINKKRSDELDEKRAEMKGLEEQFAARGQQLMALQTELADTQRQLESERAAATDLRTRLAAQLEADTNTGQEVSELRARVEAADMKLSEVEPRVVTAEARLQASEADRAKLAEQLVMLLALREERTAALAALAEAREGQAALEAFRVRCEAAEAARDRAAEELSRVSVMMGNLEARLQQVEDENEGLVAELDEERRRSAALARTWAGELEALPTLPRDRWPAAVRRLVDGIENRASGGGQHLQQHQQSALDHQGSARLSETSGHSHSEDTAAPDLEALREAAMAAAQRTARAEAEAATANAALDTLRQQMEELRIWGETEARAEASRRLEAVGALRAQLLAQGSELEEELRATREQLRAAEEGTAQLQEELHRLRDKSRAMLEEKDSEADALRLEVRRARATAAAAAGTSSSASLAPLHKTTGGSSSASISGAALVAAEGEAAQPQLRAQVNTTSSSGVASLPDEDAAGLGIVALRSQIASLQQELGEYKHAYEDAESTHQLRDTAQAALREELARLQAQLQLSNQDVQYLRAAVISFFESGSLPREGPVLQVLSRVLRFTPAEMAAIASSDHTSRGRRVVSGGAVAPPSLAAAGQPAAATAGSSFGLLAAVTKVAAAVSGRGQPT